MLVEGYIYIEKAGSTKAAKMAIDRLGVPTGKKKHTAKAR